MAKASRKEERVKESNENTIGKTYHDAASSSERGRLRTHFKSGLFKCLSCVLLWTMCDND